jgi:hypothetical protein
VCEKQIGNGTHVLTLFRLFVYWWNQMRVAFVLFELWRTTERLQTERNRQKKRGFRRVRECSKRKRDNTQRERERERTGLAQTARGRRRKDEQIAPWPQSPSVAEYAQYTYVNFWTPKTRLSREKSPWFVS